MHNLYLVLAAQLQAAGAIFFTGREQHLLAGQMAQLSQLALPQLWLDCGLRY